MKRLDPRGADAMAAKNRAPGMIVAYDNFGEPYPKILDVSGQRPQSTRGLNNWKHGMGDENEDYEGLSRSYSQLLPRSESSASLSFTPFKRNLMRRQQPEEHNFLDEKSSALNLSYANLLKKAQEAHTGARYCSNNEWISFEEEERHRCELQRRAQISARVKIIRREKEKVELKKKQELKVSDDKKERLRIEKKAENKILLAASYERTREKLEKEQAEKHKKFHEDLYKRKKLRKNLKKLESEYAESTKDRRQANVQTSMQNSSHAGSSGDRLGKKLIQILSPKSQTSIKNSSRTGSPRDILVQPIAPLPFSAPLPVAPDPLVSVRTKGMVRLGISLYDLTAEGADGHEDNQLHSVVTMVVNGNHDKSEQTERVMNSRNPRFVRVFKLKVTESDKLLRFDVHAIKEDAMELEEEGRKKGFHTSQQSLIGCIELELKSFLEQGKKVVKYPLLGKIAGNKEASSGYLSLHLLDENDPQPR